MPEQVKRPNPWKRMMMMNIKNGIGNSSAISTSKMMKISAIRKNRDETGSRAECFWIKPTFKW